MTLADTNERERDSMTSQVKAPKLSTKFSEKRPNIHLKSPGVDLVLNNTISEQVQEYK